MKTKSGIIILKREATSCPCNSIHPVLLRNLPSKITKTHIFKRLHPSPRKLSNWSQHQGKISLRNSLFQTPLTSTVTVVFSSVKKKRTHTHTYRHRDMFISSHTHTHFTLSHTHAHTTHTQTPMKPACSATKQQKQVDILFVKPDLPYWLSDTGQGLSVACKPRKQEREKSVWMCQ